MSSKPQGIQNKKAKQIQTTKNKNLTYHQRNQKIHLENLHSTIPILKKCRPVSWGCRIRWLHLCRGVNPPPQRGYLLAMDGDLWCLRTGSWWLSSTWPENRVVKSLATHHFGPYWARRAVGEARSDQLAGHDSTLLDFFFKI